jgi:FkbM family methyltransferase
MGFGMGSDVSTSGEHAALCFLKDWLSTTPTIFDVGANNGTYTQLILSLFPGANVFSFEPSPTAFQSLAANIGNNNGINLINSGFSSIECETSLYSDQAESGLASVYQRRLNHFNINFSVQERITLTTLDAFCAAHAIEYIDLLKLDTEGHEPDILRGSVVMLESNSIGAVQFEFGGCNIDSRSFFQDFYYLLNPRYYSADCTGSGGTI